MSIKISRSYVRQTSLSLTLLICAAALAGCGGGGSGDKAASASTVTAAAPTPPPATTTPPAAPTPPVQQNTAPTISGTPIQAVNMTASYAFIPNASDADGDALAFSIANKPEWADFDTATGRLSGTPTPADVGTYSGITITVNDGAASRSLQPFSIAVTQTAVGNALLSWTPPTQNVDGSQLSGLSGYRIYYCTSPEALTQSIEIGDGLSSYVVEGLSPATWYFSMKALANGTESDFSGVASKTIS